MDRTEVEITIRDGAYRYREIRYPGDDTARWITRARALRLVGAGRFYDLTISAMRKALS